MKTIVKIEIADCDGGGFAWVVCDDFDVLQNPEQFDTEEEAEAALNS